MSRIQNIITSSAARIRSWAVVSTLTCASLLLFASCAENADKEDEFPHWQETNLKEWNSVYARAKECAAAGDPAWKVIRSWNYEETQHDDNTQYIVAHVLKEGTGSGCPLYTDSVRVHYAGRLLPSASYPKGYEFDSSWKHASSMDMAVPAKFAVSALKEGFATALQHMHVGDEWEVYMPWTLAYGGEGSGAIPAYSMLIFNIKLVSYYRPGAPVPDFKAKRGWLVEQP